jgi:hypothetical protein
MTKIISVIIAAVMIFSFGCKRKDSQPAVPQRPDATSDVRQQAEDEITPKNMDEHLEKIEKEIKADVNAG